MIWWSSDTAMSCSHALLELIYLSWICRLEELNVIDVQFLHGCKLPTIILVHQVGFFLVLLAVKITAKAVWVVDSDGDCYVGYGSMHSALGLFWWLIRHTIQYYYLLTVHRVWKSPCRLNGLSMAMPHSTYSSSHRLPTSRLDKDCGLHQLTIHFSFLLSDCLLLDVAPSLSSVLAYGTTYQPMSPQHHLCSPSENNKKPSVSTFRHILA